MDLVIVAVLLSLDERRRAKPKRQPEPLAGTAPVIRKRTGLVEMDGS
jgi:hypothetical protein